MEGHSLLNVSETSRVSNDGSGGGGGESNVLWGLLVVTAALAATACYRRGTQRPGSSSRIPGPRRWPLIGSVALLGYDLLGSLGRLRKTYGDVYAVKIGSIEVVVLNGMRCVREALVERGDAFAGRPPLFSFQLTSEGKSMVFNSFDERWKAHRRLAERALKLADRESGFLDTTIEEEFATLMTKFAGYGRAACDPESDVMWSVARAKYRLCYGGTGQANFALMVERTLSLIGCHNRGSFMNFFPWLRTLLFPFRRRVEQLCAEILTLTRDEEARHLATYEEGSVRDCLDALIALGVKQACPLEPDRVMHTVQEYLGAGMDIVYITIYWAVLLLAAHPAVQEKIQEEVDAMRRRHAREPRVSDMHEMCYTHACVHEVFRFSCAVPFSLPHATTRDTQVDGIAVPSGMFVLVNLYSINRDPDVWDRPDEFRPERFLEDDDDDDSGGGGGAGAPGGGPGIRKAATEHYSVFGMGRRRCVGEHIARGEVFLFIVRLLARFRVRKPEGDSDYSLAAQPGVVLRPASYKAVFIQREYPLLGDENDAAAHPRH